MPIPQRPKNFPNKAATKCTEWHQRLTFAVDAGIASTVFVAPMFMGGRGPVGRFVFVLCVAVTAMLWCARQCIGERTAWRKSGAEALLLAGLGLLLLQLIPVPASILSLLSPQISELLPLWSPSAETAVLLGTWNQVSLHPFATQNGLATYVAYATLFLVVFQRFESRHDVERLLRLIAVATCIMAVLGLAQFLLSNGKFLWVFAHVSRDTTDVVKGPFQNQNHFAHLLALGIGPLLWWLASLQSESKGRHARGSRGSRGFRGSGNYLEDPTVQSQALWIALGTVTFAALLTFSRGGVVVTLLAAAMGVGLLSWQRMFSKRALVVVAAIACLVVVSLSIHGYGSLARKLGTFSEAESIDELSHGRWALWSAHFKAIPDFWLLGSGVGTHRDIYPTYLSEHFDVEFTHGESGYFQLLLETGVLGTGLIFVGLVLAGRWATLPLFRSTDRTTVACVAAILPGLLVSVFHSLGDFVWYIPACMTTTVLLLASACYLFRCSLPSSDPTEQPSSIFIPRSAWMATSVVCLLLFTQLAGSLLGPAKAAPSWYEYQRVLKTTDTVIWHETASEDLAAMAANVEATVIASPRDARAHAQLAGLYLQEFDIVQQGSRNPMPLSQIRDAALASQFASRRQLDDWLDLAVGENRQLFDLAYEHALQSVRLCPLQGEAYALLARLAFLEGPDTDRKGLYVQQALLVRPYHSRVHFVAGQESLLAGDVEQAMVHWKNAFHGEREVQDELVRELAAAIPAAELLVAMEPGGRGLEAMFNHYKQAGEVESAKVVATRYTQYLTEKLSTDPKVNKLGTLKRLSNLYEYLESPDKAILLAQEASALAPSDFDVRFRLAHLLIAAGRFEEAQVELQWCARRKPDHAGIRQLLATANRKSLLRQADASTASPSGEPSRQ